MRAHILKGLVVGLLIVAFGSMQTQSAFAQNNGDRIDGNISGAVGLGLLGAEVGLFLPPAFNLQDHVWAWLLFPTVLGAGGAVAGTFAFTAETKPAVGISILGAGMVLAVPAIVSAAALSSKRRGNDLRAQGGGLLRFNKEGTKLGAPDITTVAVFTPTEQSRYNLPNRTSTRVSLISGTF